MSAEGVRQNEPADPLVSILMPAYTPDYLADALTSATEQTYPHLEIIVVDDRPGSPIEEIVGSFVDDRIIFVQNESNVGSVATYERCFSLARGEYIKFLNDDDILAPHCVRRMVDTFAEHGDSVSLVTSRRRVIDAAGEALPQGKATLSPFRRDSLVSGRDFADLLLRTLNNFVGEPSTAMFRRADVGADDRSIFEFGGRRHTMNVDVALWLQLMLRGDVVYLVEPLSSLRRHGAQEQQNPQNALALRVAWLHLLRDARSEGLLADDDAWREANLRCLYLFERTISSGSLAPAENEVLERHVPQLRHVVGTPRGRPARPPRVARVVRRTARRPGWRPPLRYRYL